MNELTEYSADHSAELVKNKAKADRNTLVLDRIHLDYELDTLKKDSVKFKGFKAEFFESGITGIERLRYDRNEQWEGFIPQFKHYKGVDEVRIPDYYYVPQAWSDVVERLQANEVKMNRLSTDTVLEVDAYFISSYETSDRPYEGHFVHTKVDTRVERQLINFLKGDYIIPTAQLAKRYIVNVLEPRAKDSFFRWGFFDAVLQQKEWFSPYVFEDMALDILEEDNDLKKRFEKKKEDESFANDMWAQLIFIYRNSDFYEKGHMRYPIYRSPLD
ncbi:MAG: hypothetical protein HKN45_05030 [Flavobacteriales bacterium]|nr:hypothetical protein [Flavobacteriales bacterium]